MMTFVKREKKTQPGHFCIQEVFTLFFMLKFTRCTQLIVMLLFLTI